MKELRRRLYPVFQVARDTVKIFSDNAMFIYAGYTTLYLMMAMVPLLTLLIGVVNLIPDVSLLNFEHALSQFLPNLQQVRSMVHNLIANVNRQTGSLAVSVSAVVSLWSASTGVNAIQLGLCKISGTGGSFFKRRAAALLYTLLFLALIPALFIFRVLRGSIEELIAWVNSYLNIPDIMGWVRNFMEYSGLITVGAMVVVIVLTYTYLQGERRKLRCQLPGAVFTTMGWLVFSSLFETFISRFWQASSLYGSLAAIFLAAMWLKIICAILFYGAALNEALNRRRKRRAQA